MLTVSQRLDHVLPASAQLVLTYDLRCKSRLRTVLSTGEEVGLVLERGQVLRGGDLLLADDGRVIEVVAAAETVSTVATDDPRQLARASYHLGNRHVPLQIESSTLSYQHDHVLDDMVRGLGLTVQVLQTAFEPEAGAYSTNTGDGAHLHAHSHSPAPILAKPGRTTTVPAAASAVSAVKYWPPANRGE